MPFRASSLLLACAFAACRSASHDTRAAADSLKTTTPDSAVALPAGPGRIADTLLTMNGVALGAKMGQVKTRFGAPEHADTTDAGETLGYKFIAWHYPDFTVEFADSDVAYLTCLGSGCQASGQIRIGTPRASVEALLGPPLPARPENPLPVGQVMYAGLQSDCGLTLTYVDNRVSTIKLWCDYS
jgi:hypothetical protein